MTDHALFWNKLAEDYAQKPVEDPDAFERKIAITRAQMTPRDVVLDIGDVEVGFQKSFECGIGFAGYPG